MYFFRPYVTAGVALTGAGLIAITPIAAHPVDGQTRGVALTSGPSDNAFTFDGTTFDPGSDGYNDLASFFSVAPLLNIGGALNLGSGFSPTQNLDLYDASGSEFGTIGTGVADSDILGIDTAQFTVVNASPSSDAIDSALADSSGISFSDAAPISEDDLAGALFDAATRLNSLSGGFDFGDITASDVTNTLKGTDIGDALGIDAAGNFDPDDVADGITFTPDAAAAALNDIDVSDLPTDGTVYSITNFGSGFANIYEAIPNADGDAASSITDTVVTPFGNFDIPTDFDAIADLDPGAAFAGLSADGGSADLSDNAFTIGDATFDPGADGFTSVTPLFEVAPLLQLGGGSLLGINLAEQDLEVYDDSGSDLGPVTAGENTQNLLGIDSTQLTVDAYNLPESDVVSALTDSGVDFGSADTTATDVANALGGIALGGDDLTAADIVGQLSGTDIDLSFAEAGDIADALNSAAADYTPSADLPDQGTVYSVTNFGSGFANVYEAVPNADGDAASGITDTLVTPFGNFDIPTDFDAIADLDPGAAFAGLSVDGGSADLSDNAFSIGDTTFDPGADGFNDISPLSGVAPLLGIGTTILLGQNTAPQDLEVYGDSGSDLGSVETGVQTANILGIDVTQLSVTDVDPADGVDADQLPADGTVYSVTDFGSGFANVYEAIPNDEGDAASSITDTLVTPFGNFDLSTMFDAIADLMPGDAAGGVSDAGGGLFDGFLG
jgi:hypothetical protein